MAKEIKAGDVITMTSVARVPPTVRLAYIDLSAACLVASDEEADFFIRGLSDALRSDARHEDEGRLLKRA